MKVWPIHACLMVVGVLVAVADCGAAKYRPQVDVVVGSAAPELERFAARELCDYLAKVYGIQAYPARALSTASQAAFLIGSPETNATVKQVTSGKAFPKVSDQGIVLRRTELEGRPALIVGGGSPRATLWAVYELAERWGVRYLVDRDVLPADPGAFRISDVDVVMEPVFRVRAHPTIQDFAASGESWGVADFSVLIDQLAKMKFTRMNVYPFGWQPYLDWEYKGIHRKSTWLWYDYHYHITADTVGRELFGDATEFWNPDLPLTSNYQDLVEAGERQIHNLIEHAHRRGMECVIGAPVTDFPPEFGPLLKGAEVSHQLGGLTVVPGPQTALDDPQLFELSSAMLEATLNTYPEADAVMVYMPEFRQWTGEYERAWEALDAKYGISEVSPPLPELVAAAERRGGQRAVSEVKGDIASLLFYDRLLRGPEATKSLQRQKISFNYEGVAEELYPILGRLLPRGWSIGVSISNWPRDILDRREVLKNLPAQEVPGVINLTLDDDNMGVVPQLTTGTLHELVGDLRRNGWAGFIARERFPGDHDSTLAYLARAAWDAEATPDAVIRDQLRVVCGEGCADDLLQAFHEVESTTIAFDHTAFAFPADWPPPTLGSLGGMMLKHWKAGPMPDYMIKGHEGYERALAAARRAQAKAAPVGRWYADFWVGRLEFAVQYVEAAQGVQRAATAYQEKDRSETLQQADDALAALRRALEAYARVVRTQTDRGAIAVVNEHCYRPLKLRSWSLHAHGY